MKKQKNQQRQEYEVKIILRKNKTKIINYNIIKNIETGIL